MYSMLVAMAIGVVSGALWTLLGLWKTWAMGIVLFVVVSLVAFALISRSFNKKIEPVFQNAQKQIQSGAIPAAIKAFEELLPLAKWQVMLRGQLYAQMGILCYQTQDYDKARDYLDRASARVSEAQLCRAILYYQRKDLAKTKQVIEKTITYNKKKILLYNVYAYLLGKEGERDAAIEQLMRCQKVEPKNEITKDNLLRLQNGKKMNMNKFGVEWWGLGLERPPASIRRGTQEPMRKGFRQRKRR